MWAKKPASKPPMRRNTSARQQKAAPLTQKTSRVSSYCPRSFSNVRRIRPRQNGKPNQSMNPPAAPAYSNRSRSAQESSFGPTTATSGCASSSRDQRLQPPLRRFDVGVEQHPVIALQPLQRAVVTSGETVVFRQPEQRNRRKLPLDERRRPVGRTVVRHDDLHPRRSGAHHRGKEAPQMGGSVPVEYDNLYDGHCGRRCFQRRCDQSHIPGSATMSLSSCRT